jgi:type I pantothenate kinase
MTVTPGAEYLPVAELVRARRAAEPDRIGAFLIAIDGSVAVGKSTSARMISDLLDQPPDALTVEIVSTDGFLFPNRVLDARGLTMRKGFPESYDHDALQAFVASVRAGDAKLHAPVYSHETYDVLAAPLTLAAPDVLVLEGVHAMRLASTVDLAVFIDAAEPDIERWYVERFLRLRASGSAFYAQFASMSDAAATGFARAVWNEINAPNLHEHILPNRDHADVVVTKGPDHAVTSVTLRE